MIRNFFNKLHALEKLQKFQEKYNIPLEFTSARRKYVIRGMILGIFIAFIPMPLQIGLVLLLMSVYRFNVLIAVAMCFITNPFTMPPIYYIEYKIGSFLTGSDMKDVEMSLEWFNENFTNILVPLYLGAFTLSITFSFIAYYLVTHLWKKSVHEERRKDS